VSNVSGYIEGMLLLLPRDAGGRATAIAPRDGSYMPFAQVDDVIVRARVIEGPPLLAPGDEARVVVELETDCTPMPRGLEIRLLETGGQTVGMLTVVRAMHA
jgi:translation elongation factor EF-Tu-like GTPase